MTAPLPFPRTISPGNDFSVTLGPITQPDPSTGGRALYHGATVQAWLAVAADSDTPLGAVTVTATEAGATGFYVPQFDATQVDTALAAITGLANGTLVYCIARVAGDFRGYVELTVKLARQLG